MIATNSSCEFITFGVVNTFIYTNYKGEREARKMIPLCLRFGTTPYHSEAQWLMECWCMDKRAERTLELSKVEIIPTDIR